MIKKVLVARDKNRPGEEFSPRCYLNFMLKFIRSKGGIVDQGDLYAEIIEKFGPYWGPDDLRLLRNRPKWMNSVDFAKVIGRKLEEPIYSRSFKNPGRPKLTYLVLDAPDTDAELLEWAKERIPNNRFKKRCFQCQSGGIPLAAEFCPYCGYHFPPKARRKHQLPK